MNPIRKFTFKDAEFLGAGHMYADGSKDMPVQEFREMVCRNLKHMVNNPHEHPAYKQFRIVFEKDASYSYDMSVDFYEKHFVNRVVIMEDNEEYGDVTSFFKTREIGMHSLPMFFVLSATTPKLTAVWDHSIMDGVCVHSITRALMGYPIISYPIMQPLSPIELMVSSMKCIPYIGDMTLPSLLDKSSKFTRDTDTRYASNHLAFTDVKPAAKQLGVPVPAYVASLYITALFKILPDHISYLKVATPYLVPPVEGTFNSFEAIPIVVRRNKSSPTDIRDLLKNCFYFSHIIRQFTIDETIPSWAKTHITEMLGYTPDLIFSSMMHDELRMNVHVRTPTMTPFFYTCYADSNIETSCSSPAYDISKITL